MRVAIFVLLLTFSCFFQANAAPNLFSGDQPSKQALQEANADQGEWNSISNFQKKNTTPAVPAGQSIASNVSNVTYVTQPQLTQLKQKISQLTQSISQMQQIVNQNISRLNQQDFMITQRLQSLEQIARLMNQQLQLNAQKTQTQKMQSMNSFYARAHTFLGPTGFWVTLVGLVILVIAILWLIILSIKNKHAIENKSTLIDHDEDTKDEYDFMSSKDAIPAKFDLVNAYIAMENNDSAREVLEEIIKLGNEEQKIRAQKLLNNIVN